MKLKLMELLSEEKVELYQITALNSKLHFNHTYDPDTKDVKMNITISTTGGRDLIYTADNQDAYDKFTTELESSLMAITKEYNKKLSVLLKDYVTNKD